MTDTYVLWGINPQPWTVGNVGVGRKGGKVFGTVAKKAELRNYQDAVIEGMKSLDLSPEVCTTDFVVLRFYFWRQIEEYQGEKKLVVKHRADATNLQKATEDALQGILYKNDNQVCGVECWIVEQERGENFEPCIVFEIEKFHPSMLPLPERPLRGAMTEHIPGSLSGTQ